MSMDICIPASYHHGSSRHRRKSFNSSPEKWLLRHTLREEIDRRTFFSETSSSYPILITLFGPLYYTSARSAVQPFNPPSSHRPSQSPESKHQNTPHFRIVLSEESPQLPPVKSLSIAFSAPPTFLDFLTRELITSLCIIHQAESLLEGWTCTCIWFNLLMVCIRRRDTDDFSTSLYNVRRLSQRRFNPSFLLFTNFQ